MTSLVIFARGSRAAAFETSIPPTFALVQNTKR
jgi:hypothetical protein